MFNIERKIYTDGMGAIIDPAAKEVILPQDYLLRVPSSILVEFLDRHYPCAPERRRQQAVLGFWTLENTWEIKKLQILTPALGAAATQFKWQFERGIVSREDVDMVATIPENERSLIHVQDEELNEIAVEALAGMNGLRKQNWNAGLRFIKANYPIWRDDRRKRRVHFSDPLRTHSGP